MKKLLWVIIFLPMFSFAQVEIVPFAGYLLGGGITFYEGKLKVSSGLDYGGSLLVPIRDVVDLELNYTRTDCDYEFTSYYPNLYGDATESGSINYIQIGTLKYLDIQNPDLKPFGSISLGATWFTVDGYEATWRFSVIVGGGLKYMFSDRVGIMLRGRLLMPMNFSGVYGYYGFGGSSGLSVSTYSTLFQGDFTGGLVIAFGNN